MSLALLLVTAASAAPAPPSDSLLRELIARTALAQVERMDPAWQVAQRDCAGLVRFAYRTAFKRLRPGRLATPLWVDARGRGVDFADAETLVTGSFALLGRDESARAALRSGDLLAFRQEGEAGQPVYHLMLVARPEDPAHAEPRVVYHPGMPGAAVRVGSLRQLTASRVAPGTGEPRLPRLLSLQGVDEMSQPPRPPSPLWVKPAIGLGFFLAFTITFALLHEGPPASPGGPTPVTWGNAKPPARDGMPPAPTTPVEMEVPEQKTEPGVWVDVKHPDRVRAALFSNEWLQATLKHPLGMGFVGPWAAFLGSKGEDLKAAFSGTVLGLVAEQLLASPFQVVWFSGEGPAGPPVVIIRDPPSGAQAAFAALDKVARRGVLTAARCPGESGSESGQQLEVARWLLAEHALYAASGPGRLVLGRHPLGVLQGLCAELPAPSDSDADLEVAVAAERLGRDAQALTHALGLEKVVRLQLAAEKATFVPRGLWAAVAQPGRLDAAPLSDDLLRAIPEDMPVLLTLQLKLPAALGAESLKRFWSGGQAETLTRQVAVLWSPRGDANLPTEVAVLWSRAEDAAALQGIFHGGNTLVARSVCKQQAFASTEELMKRLEAACAGKSPSVLAAAPAVLAGLRAPSSLALGVNLGRLLPQLTLDGYWSETGVSLKAPLPRAAPPEIEQARGDLSLLPFIGFSGSAQERTWVPGGFRS